MTCAMDKCYKYRVRARGSLYCEAHECKVPKCHTIILMGVNTVLDINANINIVTMERTSILTIAVHIPHALHTAAIT
ncbi:uncharacterized protein EAF02_010033 [Botrytis sinoallii]|uniref:uncharacterized protein n=1 Tax=Botrytis sinoallii TaxID=1463999 RepID=UPI001900AAED|nr:uncharacterized protein EAF02_010033 [Botrytis sinoallii]KAF7865610.1 hypothetical protein EAF02_010033 [Botrytis sinoallii]